MYKLQWLYGSVVVGNLQTEKFLVDSIWNKFLAMCNVHLVWSPPVAILKHSYIAVGYGHYIVVNQARANNNIIFSVSVNEW